MKPQGKGEQIVGTFKIEFNKLAESNKFKEFPLIDCKDSKSQLSISVNFIEKGKGLTRSKFSKGNLKPGTSTLLDHQV